MLTPLGEKPGYMSELGRALLLKRYIVKIVKAKVRIGTSSKSAQHRCT